MAKCRLGHEWPTYGQAKIGAIDGIGRIHCDIVKKCLECGEIKRLGRFHLPQKEAAEAMNLIHPQETKILCIEHGSSSEYINEYDTIEEAVEEMIDPDNGADFYQIVKKLDVEIEKHVRYFPKVKE